jgi:hypothetical protein
MTRSEHVEVNRAQLETARPLRSGGRLGFMRGSTLRLLCGLAEDHVGERIELEWNRLGRMDLRAEGGGIEFHPPTGVMLDFLRRAGFALLALLAPADAKTHPYHDYVTADWRRRRPSVEIWAARMPA